MTIDINALPGRLREKIYIEPNTGCWLWLGALTGPGNTTQKYGHNYFSGKHYRTHRFTYEFYRGLIPDGQEIDHLCRTRSCCNPLHLEIVNRSINLRRGIGNLNKNKTHCKRGHPFNSQNTLWESRGGRQCRECSREYHREYMRKRRHRLRPEG